MNERKTFSGSADDLKSGGHLQQSDMSTTTEASSNASTPQATPSSNYSHIPRRTSFGTALTSGSRFTPFSAFGFSPGSPLWSSSQRGSAISDDLSPLGGPGDLRKKPSTSYFSTPDQKQDVGSAESTPAPSLPASPVQKPQRSRTVYLPGPDGICVETRARK
jgi:hypothetical protein